MQPVLYCGIHFSMIRMEVAWPRPTWVDKPFTQQIKIRGKKGNLRKNKR